MAYSVVCYDITGGCNAKCPLCVTGRVSFGKKISYVSVADFERTIDHLIAEGMIEPGVTVINPYSWGEPLLHPDLDGIVDVLTKRHFGIGFSTNGSKKTNFTVPTGNIVDFCFSMPGFSQKSYDLIHGFKFEKILENIEATMENVTAQGYGGIYGLVMHVYQFNALDEMDMAREWAKSKGMRFIPLYAYINDYDQLKAFLKGTLDEKSRADISRKLFLHYHEELIAKHTEGFVCSQWDKVLTIDHNNNLLLCCSMTSDHPNAGPVLDLSAAQVHSYKTTNAECDECIGCGVAQWGHNTVMLDDKHGYMPPPRLALEAAPEPALVSAASAVPTLSSRIKGRLRRELAKLSP
jgi:MoaA/NifB/PqqE/SkfB family radical SAM enzyme